MGEAIWGALRGALALAVYAALYVGVVLILERHIPPGPAFIAFGVLCLAASAVEGALIGAAAGRATALRKAGHHVAAAGVCAAVGLAAAGLAGAAIWLEGFGTPGGWDGVAAKAPLPFLGPPCLWGVGLVTRALRDLLTGLFAGRE